MNRSEPTFWVAVQELGKPTETRVDVSARVTSLEYQDEEDKSDQIKLAVVNHDLRSFDEPLWRPGNLIRVGWGYVGDMGPPREARITKVGGSTELTIEAQGRECELNRIVRKRLFENTSRSAVARQIALEHGYAVDQQFVDWVAGGEETVMQAGETDLQFLRRLAETEGFEFYVDVEGFHFHERRLGQKPVRELRWYLPGREDVAGEVGDVVSWEVESDIYGTPRQRPAKVVVEGRDPGTKEDFAEEASFEDTIRDSLAALPPTPSPDLVETLLGLDAVKELFNPTTEKEDVRRTAQTTAAAAKREADGIYKKAALDAVELNMQLVGDPTLRAKSVVKVSGISKRLAGLYYVKASTHSIGSGGYTTSVKLSSDGVEQYLQDQAERGSALAAAQRAGKANPNQQDCVGRRLHEVTFYTIAGPRTRYFDSKTGVEVPSWVPGQEPIGPRE